MDLAIIIPAYNDVRILDCIKSIDERVEVVVVLNGATKEVENIVHSLDVRVCFLKEPNLAKAYNAGIEYSNASNVLLMDSDCVFKSGTIRKLYNLLDNCSISKGRVIFSYKSKSEKVTATARHIHNTRKNAYSPPLTFKKSIKKEIGNYYFDEVIKWTEDYDFDIRVSKAKLRLDYDHSAIVVHPKLDFWSDLKSGYNYGTGHGRGYFLKKDGYRYPKFNARSLYNSFTKVKGRYGVFVGVYIVIWQICFLIGAKKTAKKKLTII